jgi:hypothetical protein
MLGQSPGIVENRRGKNDCLFAISRVIVTNNGLCERFMCCAAMTTPTINKSLINGWRRKVRTNTSPYGMRAKNRPPQRIS